MTTVTDEHARAAVLLLSRFFTLMEAGRVEVAPASEVCDAWIRFNWNDLHDRYCSRTRAKCTCGAEAAITLLKETSR